ncbi:hypothetical protein SAMN04490183_2295 [Pseudomonas corrugata]|nr:hypothetical protein SAMN04490183_2295 [Pseudomonas corrugata]
MERRHRGQARLPQVQQCPLLFRTHHNSPVGACSRKQCICHRDVEWNAVIAGKPGSHRFSSVPNAAHTTTPLWERACSRKRCICHRDVEYAAVIAGKPGSHRFSSVPNTAHTTTPLWEPARESGVSATEMLNGTPSSRASPAPTGSAVSPIPHTPQLPCGSEPARDGGSSANNHPASNHPQGLLQVAGAKILG